MARVLAGLLVAPSAGALAACGASPAAVGPTGIDGLVIPTPSPDPADFGGNAANPWFPLAAGTRWTYRQYLPDGYRVLVATVLPGSRRIAGVEATPVRWQSVSGRRTRTLLVRWYAVDRAGDVWWLGQRVVGRRGLDPLARRSWLAGVHGAEAGLVLSGHPRAGDGYYNARRPLVVERRSTVESLDATVSTPQRTYRHTIGTRDLSSLAPLHVVLSYYARGLGLVAQQDTRAVSTSLTLVGMSRP